MRKPVFGGFRPSQTQTRLYRSKLDASNFEFRKYSNYTLYVVKMKALISCMATVQLICTFVFALAKSRFSHIIGE